MEYTEEIFDQVVLGKKLASGSYGSVYVGLLPNGAYIGVKKIEHTEGSSPSSIEIDVHKQLIHPNIVRYLGSKSTTNGRMIYLEYVTGGSITSIMRSLPGSKLPLSVVRVYSRQIFSGLAYLHSKGISHRDIKGDNILVSMDTGIVKLADFDQAKVIGSQTHAKTLAGTPYWMAPEVITEEQGYDAKKADVWSAACVVAEMYSGEPPWKTLPTPIAIVCKIADSKEGWPDNISPEGMPQDMIDFLNQCFGRNAGQRPTSEQCLGHSFLTAK